MQDDTQYLCPPIAITMTATLTYTLILALLLLLRKAIKIKEQG